VTSETVRERIKRYFEGHLVVIYTVATQVTPTNVGFADSFVGFVHEVAEFDIVLRHIGSDDKHRFSLIPLSVIVNISQAPENEDQQAPEDKDQQTPEDKDQRETSMTRETSSRDSTIPSK
jgi:hypothetical protein